MRKVACGWVGFFISERNNYVVPGISEIAVIIKKAKRIIRGSYFEA